MMPVNNTREAPTEKQRAADGGRVVAFRSLAAAAVGIAVWAAASAGQGRAGAAAQHGACFSALRLLRHAVAAYEAQHGSLPGHPRGGTVPADPELITRQLTLPRDAAGMPAAAGPFAGLLEAIPVNPYTGSASLAVVPAGADAGAFAAASRCGWAYLGDPGRDAAGPLPAGLLLPCGDNGGHPPDRGLASVQDIAFEIEDFERWR
jgi:hypothetical protein